MKRHYWDISASTIKGWSTVQLDTELQFISQYRLGETRKLIADEQGVEINLVKIESISYLGHMTKEQWEN